MGLRTKTLARDMCVGVGDQLMKKEKGVLKMIVGSRDGASLGLEPGPSGPWLFLLGHSHLSTTYGGLNFLPQAVLSLTGFQASSATVLCLGGAVLFDNLDATSYPHSSCSTGVP